MNCPCDYIMGKMTSSGLESCNYLLFSTHLSSVLIIATRADPNNISTQASNFADRSLNRTDTVRVYALTLLRLLRRQLKAVNLQILKDAAKP